MNFEQRMFSDLSQMKATDYKNLSEMFEEIIMFPKQSKVLGKNFLRDIQGANSPMMLVIVSHLYFDYIFRLLLKKHSINGEARRYQSFKQKLDEIQGLGCLTSADYRFLCEINKIRNQFVHNVFYDITEHDPMLFPQVSQYGLVVPKRKDLLISFYLVFIKVTFSTLFIRLTRANRWLYLEDVPQRKS